MDQQEAASHSEYQEVYENSKPRPWVERNGFAHWAMALTWVLVALIAFNVVGAIVGVIGILATSDNLNMEVMMEELSTNFDILFLANSSGQILIMALATLLVVRLHAVKGERKDFLRLNITKNTWVVTVIAAVLFVVAQPTILFLGWLNSFIPVPEAMAQMQETMAEMIATFLKSDNVLLLGVFHIGIVPAVCEEIMYRGYVQRAFEKSWGIVAAILISGAIFGAYHLQISNFLPLATLGVFLAYVTYISDSLIPAMVAHFVNNGGQVIASSFYPEMLDEKITPDMDIPYLLVFGSMILTAAILYYLKTLKPNEAEE
ncbi:MAG: CPBP family intramembrane metalloprotease domain-containing protein [Balneola sp.]|nr:CPBP family intramembrane metalloprotease domain-containing protein [Balneola sp.]MBE80862.1 CPBP family intramembrane metalloprotease domain-containing protein [Balneola sp.]HBX67208.1 CPBP family intramembrane metalloprotease domain-containing protein [Balneolaceae bacterium]|tara:strand:- start:1448 stop:2398 length:951 start_codon:yes stop_codon:yes gene_type:complete